MASLTTIDLNLVARPLRLPRAQVEATVALLDAGNTVPFITRYRKDQTGGLDEEQVREVQARITQLRQLAERKQTILRSIDAQGKLTPELAALIEAADTSKRLEDLYLPFKPKKQTLATAARERGLEPLAREILTADPLANPDAAVSISAWGLAFRPRPSRRQRPQRFRMRRTRPIGAVPSPTTSSGG